MRTLTLILLTTLLPLATHAASSSIDGEIFVAAGTTGTNALPSSRTTNITISATSKVADGTTGFNFNASTTHTTGYLLTLQNNTTNIAVIDYNGGLTLGRDGFEGAVTISSTNGTYAITHSVDSNGSATLDTEGARGSGNLLEVKNNGTTATWITYGGISASTNGIATGPTDAAVTIAATGWTNTFGKNAVVYLTGTNVTYTVYNNAGTAIYTNLTTSGVMDTSILLQPSGKVIASGTAVFGRATPF